MWMLTVAMFLGTFLYMIMVTILAAKLVNFVCLLSMSSNPPSDSEEELHRRLEIRRYRESQGLPVTPPTPYSQFTGAWDSPVSSGAPGLVGPSVAFRFEKLLWASGRSRPSGTGLRPTGSS